MSAPVPVILDVDGSVLPVADNEIRLPLSRWQEAVRFSCSMAALRRLQTEIEPFLPEHMGCVFLGSGDFHHLTLLPLARVKGSLDLVVLDNHPDNMRYPFGVHCGSWVSHAAALPKVRAVHVLGITSEDIGSGHAWENRLMPLLRRKLIYWSVNRPASWLKMPGLRGRHRDFPSADDLTAAFLPVLEQCGSVYLSIDKDVLSPEEARTNWDQGMFSRKHLETVIRGCAGKLAGADVTGEVSEYAYQNPFKALLSQLDGQKPLPPELIAAWQEDHRALNRELLPLLHDAMTPRSRIVSRNRP